MNEQTGFLPGEKEKTMLLLNYSHPITPSQLAQITEMIGVEPAIRAVPVQIDQSQCMADQIAALADASGLSPEAWQTTPIIINPPGFAPATLALIAEVHGRIGHFPTVMRLRPVTGSTPLVYEVAELLNLQTIREQARQRR